MKNSKNIICWIIVFSIIFSFAGCKKKNNEQEQNIDTVFWTAPLTVKYMIEESPDIKYGENPSIEMCKNEVESAQFIVTPGENISSYNITIGNVTDGKNVIPSENIAVFVEHYINVTQPTSTYQHGYYPDAMIPLSLVKSANEDKIKKGQNQAFVIQVRTDENTVAGNYSGKISIKLNEKEYQKTLNVRVWNYAISTQSHSTNFFPVWDDQLFYGHHTVTEELKDNYYEFLNDYRMFAAIPNVNSYDSEIEKAEKVVKYAMREDVGGINLPYTTISKVVEKGKYKGQSYYTFEPYSMEVILRELVKKEKQTGLKLLDKCYVYIGALDEPPASRFYMVREANNDFMKLKQEIANDYNLFPLGEYGDIKDSLLNMDFVITTPIRDKLMMDRENNNYKGVDTWCPTFDEFSLEEDRERAEERQKAGDHVWWYGCLNPKSPYPTYHTDDNLISARMINWMMMDYNIEGNLYWSTTIFSKYKMGFGYGYRNIWKDPLAFPNANGDGYLVYPGKKYGIDGPLPTIRLEAIRDGMEDYESLYLLRTLSEDLTGKFGVKFNFNEYMDELYSLLFNGVIANQDEQRLLFVRREIAKMIEACKNGVFATYDRNDKTNKVTAKVYTDKKVENVKVNNKAGKCENKGVGNIYTFEFIPSSNDQQLHIEYTLDGESFIFNKYITGNVKIIKDFDNISDLNDIKVSDGDEYDEKEDVKISTSSKLIASLKSLKIELSGITGNVGYRPNVEFKISLNDDDENIKFYIYNESLNKISVDVRLNGANTYVDIYNFTVNGKEGKEVVFSIEQVENISQFKSMQILFPHLEGEENAVLYMDNLATCSNNYKSLESLNVTCEHSDELFGNYQDTENGNEEFTRAEGVLFDFEEDASMLYNIGYRDVNPSISIVHDKKYVTSLNGALKVVVRGIPQAGPNICPAIRFFFNDDQMDMRNAKKVIVDVTVESDRTLELGFNILFNSGLATSNRVISIKPGKQQFVFDFEGKHRVKRSDGIKEDVYLTDEEKLISALEVWTWNLTGDQTPFNLIFDNLRVVY